jgi:hypothetical protein
MKGRAVVSGGHMLAERYESLRQDVLELSGRGRTLHGRAVLMFKGMAVWMRCVGDAAPNPASAAARSESRLPAGIEQNLINIVATMTLATARESMT